MGRGQTLNALRKHFVPQMTLSDRYAENVPLFSQASNLYEIEEPTVNTNRLWTRLNKYNITAIYTYALFIFLHRYCILYILF